MTISGWNCVMDKNGKPRYFYNGKPAKMIEAPKDLECKGKAKGKVKVKARVPIIPTVPTVHSVNVMDDARIRELESLVRKLAEESHTSEVVYRDAVSKLKKSEIEKSQIERELESEKSKIEPLHDEVTSLQGVIKRMLDDMDLKENELTKCRNDLAYTSTTVERLNKITSMLQHNASDNATKIRQHTQKEKEYENALSDLNSKIGKLEDLYTSKDKELNALYSELSKYRTDTKDLQNKIQTLQKEKSDISSKYESLNVEKMKIDAAFRDYILQSVNKEKELRKMFDDTVKRKDVEIAVAITENVKLKKSIEEYEKAKKIDVQQRAYSSTLYAELLDKYKNLSSTVDSLNKELADTRYDNELLYSQLSDISTKLLYEKNKVSQYKSREKALLDEVNRLRDALAKLENEMESKENRYNELLRTTTRKLKEYENRTEKHRAHAESLSINFNMYKDYVKNNMLHIDRIREECEIDKDKCIKDFNQRYIPNDESYKDKLIKVRRYDDIQPYLKYLRDALYLIEIKYDMCPSNRVSTYDIDSASDNKCVKIYEFNQPRLWKPQAKKFENAINSLPEVPEDQDTRRRIQQSLWSENRLRKVSLV